MCLLVYRYSSLFHNLKKSSLGFAGGSVDLICQKHVAHHSSGTVNEFAGLLFIHGKSGHI